jgi:NAD(P)H-hydrate repair Nnr-like enzyme with NAD(P)H-hydrate dehydratase domain
MRSQHVQEVGIPVVIDADGIAVVEHLMNHRDVVFDGVSRAVFTPNVPEFWRLCDACSIPHGSVQPCDDSALVQVCSGL